MIKDIFNDKLYFLPQQHAIVNGIKHYPTLTCYHDVYKYVASFRNGYTRFKDDLDITLYLNSIIISDIIAHDPSLIYSYHINLNAFDTTTILGHRKENGHLFYFRIIKLNIPVHKSVPKPQKTIKSTLKLIKFKTINALNQFFFNGTYFDRR